MRNLSVIAAAAALVVLGCSSNGRDDGSTPSTTGPRSDEEQAYVDALTEDQIDAENGEPSMDRSVYECTSVALVDVIGFDELSSKIPIEDVEAKSILTLSQAGIELSDRQRDSLFDRLNECMEVRTVLLDGFAATGLSEEAISCIDDALTDDVMKDITLGVVLDGESYLDQSSPAMETFLEAATRCAGEEELDERDESAGG